MKKLVFLLFGFAFITTNAQTVDEIIQKYAASVGSLASVTAVKTAKMTGTLTVQGMDLPITILVVNGKAVRSDVEVMGSTVISSYKDGKGWKQNQFAGAPDPTEVTAAELVDLKAQTMIANPLMDYKARGHKVELQGQTDLNGVKAYKIQLTSKDDGKTTQYFINATDYTLIESISEKEMMGQTATVETWFSDLKEINGLKFYMSRVQKIDGTEVQSMKFDKIELNVPIDEKIFDMPK